MNLFDTSDCSGDPAASGSAADFASPGIPVAVDNDTTTTLKATATDEAGNESPCSSSSATYVEDSSAPVPPTVNDSDPGSGSAELSPKIKGTAESGSSVKLFATTSCSGSPVATGSAADFLSQGFTVTVGADTTTIFKATATDGAGNESGCSAGYTYINDTGPANFLVDNPTVIEGTGAGTTVLRFNVEMSKPKGAQATVKVNTADGTALAGSDYNEFPLTKLTFPAGQTGPIPVDVQVIRDVGDEPAETVFLKLSSPTGANLPDPKGVGTITRRRRSADPLDQGRDEGRGGPGRDLQLQGRAVGAVRARGDVQGRDR